MCPYNKLYHVLIDMNLFTPLSEAVLSRKAPNIDRWRATSHCCIVGSLGHSCNYKIEKKVQSKSDFSGQSKQKDDIAQIARQQPAELSGNYDDGLYARPRDGSLLRRWSLRRYFPPLSRSGENKDGGH